MKTRDDVKQLADRLRTERDELRVQLDLAKKEARDEWTELEDKWDHLRRRLSLIRDEADDASGEAAAAANLLADEIKNGYERIRKLI